ncbi:MAG TPA: hypothetical protein VK939_11875 [Longimicrobiales bacterium]|nr:hypothetical protein [Longimicrobiales bacterium]
MHIRMLIVAVLLASCASAGERRETTSPDPGTPPPLYDPYVLPAGVLLDVQLADTIRAETARVGDRFAVTLTGDLTTVDNRVALPAGTVITGLITGVDDTDHPGDPAYVRLNFVRITVEKSNHPFAAEIVSTNVRTEAPADLEDAAEAAGIGALAGVVGAIISGDARTALESAALGAGAGTVISLGTDAERAFLPAGMPLTLRATSQVDLRR